MKRGFKVAEVEQKLRELDGNMAAVARCYGVHRSTMKRFVDQHTTLLLAAHDSHECLKDDVENVLHKAARAGEAWAVCFYLKCRAKDRGYVERQELTGPDGRPVEVTEVVVTTRQEAAKVLAALPDAGGVPLK